MVGRLRQIGPRKPCSTLESGVLTFLLGQLTTSMEWTCKDPQIDIERILDEYIVLTEL